MQTNSPTVRTTINFGLGQGVRLQNGLEPLWCGVIGGKIVRPNGVGAVMEVKKGDILTIFFPDGNVGKLDCGDLSDLSARKPVLLQAPDALGERLDVIVDNLQLARSNSNISAGVRAEDYWLHQLASMLRMAGRFPDLRKKVIFAAEKHINGHGVRPKVRKHFDDVLKALGDRTLYGWLLNEAEEADSNLQMSVKELKRKIWEQHQLLDQAMSGVLPWESVAASFKALSEKGEFGFSARKRFCTNCPPNSGLSAEVGNLPVAHVEKSHGPSPLKNKTMSRAEADKRRRQNRAQRHSQQASKGPRGKKK